MFPHVVHAQEIGVTYIYLKQSFVETLFFFDLSTFGASLFPISSALRFSLLGPFDIEPFRFCFLLPLCRSAAFSCGPHCLQSHQSPSIY